MPPTSPQSGLPLSPDRLSSQPDSQAFQTDSLASLGDIGQVRVNLSGQRQALPRAVIFDLDGTLIDTIDDITAALNATLASEGLPPVPVHAARDWIGNGATVLIQKALSFHGRKASPQHVQELKDRYVDQYLANPVTATTPFPFAVEVLKNLSDSGVALGVCTNKPLTASELILEQLGLSHLIAVVIAPESGFGQKPDPKPLLACAERLGVPPDQTAYVGDHPVDVETARAAGIRVITVTFGYSTDTSHHARADGSINSFDELPSALLAVA
jgi:phosphoglycolate phosphatase